MPIRFRKSFTPFPGVRVNVSKGGTSITVGKKGFHLNFSKRGVKQTVGLPGSGISQTSYLVKNDTKSDTEPKQDKKEKENDHEPEEKRERVARGESPEGISGWILFLCLVVVYFGAVIL